MSIKENLKKVKRKVTGVSVTAGRDLTVFDNDIFVTSYPKSGNTWTRFLIGNLLFQDQEISFSNIEQKIPDIYQNSDKQLLSLPRPRVIKSHEYYDPRYNKVLFIVRDPRDVLVSSYFHYLRYLPENIDTPESIEVFGHKFISGEYYPVGKVNPLGSWGGNVGSWLGARNGSDDFLVIRYKDLKQDIHAQLAKIAAFFGIHCSDSAIEAAIANSSIDRMRALEKRDSNVWPARQSKRDDISFVRSAKSGDWVESLPTELADEIEKRWGTLMKTLGYLD